MDPKFKGRSWVGNLYQKFETIFQDVDEFVTKDTAKFIEDQVQAVNEGVKKLYSNVQGDEMKNKAQEAVQIKDDASGDSIMPMVGVKESSNDFSEQQLSEEPVVDSQKQLSLSPGGSFFEDIVNGSHPKEGSDAAFSETAMVCREQNLVTVEVDSPGDLKSPIPSDVSSSQDVGNMFCADPSKNVVEDVGMSTLREEIKYNTASSSEDLQTEYSSIQSDDSPTGKNAEMVVEENENVGCSENKSLCQVLCVEEDMPSANGLCDPEDKFSPFLSSPDEDYECSGFVKHFPETLVSDDRISCVSLITTIDDYADLSAAKSSLKRDPSVQVDSRSNSTCESSSDLPFCFMEEYPTSEKPSLMKDETVCEKKIIYTCDESTLDNNFSLVTSVRGELFRVLENEEEEPDVRLFYGEAETDLCFDNYHSFMLPELGLEENNNNMVQKQALKEQLSGFEDSCDFTVQLKASSVGIEGCSSPKNESSSGPSVISLPEKHTTANFAKLLPAAEAQKAELGLLHEDDKATYAICNDVLSTCNVPSDHNESSNISQLHDVVKPDAPSSSLSSELLHAKEMCCDHTHNSCSASDVSMSDLGTRDKTGNQISSFSGTSTASGHFNSLSCLENYDLAVNTVDEDLLETINLSDEPKLEDIRPMVDDELLHMPSFRYRRFRSYKELIKEAFASRKRVVKEYQQLPIWYGDFDSDSNLNPEKHLSPQTAALSEASTATLTSSHPCDTGESDWELL